MTHKEKALKHLEKAKKDLALADEPEKHAEVSNLKRELQIEDDT